MTQQQQQQRQQPLTPTAPSAWPSSLHQIIDCSNGEEMAVLHLPSRETAVATPIHKQRTYTLVKQQTPAGPRRTLNPSYQPSSAGSNYSSDHEYFSSGGSTATTPAGAASASATSAAAYYTPEHHQQMTECDSPTFKLHRPYALHLGRRS